MTEKKLKYLQYLKNFEKCPSADFIEVEREAYRWTNNPVSANDFIPVNIMSEPPPRMLDDSDKMCMAYGLSMFNSLINSLKKYEKEYKKRRQHQREQFIQDKGNHILQIKLTKNDGIADEPNEDKFGHFTFYEYSHISLEHKNSSSHNIFKDNGEFNIQ